MLMSSLLDDLRKINVELVLFYNLSIGCVLGVMALGDSCLSRLVICLIFTLRVIKFVKIAKTFAPFLRDSKRRNCCESHGLNGDGSVLR